MYFFMVALWIHNSRSIARSDSPLRGGGGRAVMVEGMSIRDAARTFGLHRDTVRRTLAYSVPPGHRRQTPPRRPKLEPYTGALQRRHRPDSGGRPQVLRKQRHTAKRIYERLRDEYVDYGWKEVSRLSLAPLFHKRMEFGGESEVRAVLPGPPFGESLERLGSGELPDVPLDPDVEEQRGRCIPVNLGILLEGV